ncbi:MAG: hypothetical protein FWD08_00185 [Alphaproteobacteria bacterium]|nr:hypothetical protein [Alphaproteobacteria bacterium]
MSDIVERLRQWGKYKSCETPVGEMAKDAVEAADEIDRLRRYISDYEARVDGLIQSSVAFAEQAVKILGYQAPPGDKPPLPTTGSGVKRPKPS